MSSVVISGDSSGAVTLAAPSAAGTTTLTLPATTGNVVVDAATQTLTNKTLTSPTITGASLTGTNVLTMASATLASPAVAGNFEYDGTAPYFTPSGVLRGVVPGMQFYRLNANLAGANLQTVQNILGVGVTLAASTVYAFQAHLVLSKTAGTTSHNFSVLFAGTATLNNIGYCAYVTTASQAIPLDGIATTVTSIVSNSAASIRLNNTSVASAAYTFSTVFHGTISVNGGGTFIPQYQLSAAPGGAYSTIAGSYFAIYPVGAAGANVNVGTWA